MNKELLENRYVTKFNFSSKFRKNGLEEMQN
ncbi:hypothetical protein GFO_0935 [Christiangramia forsetii KT0803]|uniref:Uncharacterized protein n=1 Tax=Christiangramia forsetii (strain DSM 17595 / CGMCC 1.15422 / KT0803) TaxID=411154 RepID=A0LZW4_CHRFK|nr:hypothetical protein GFO_0935 [Christiangramia forsetii KT0803]